MFSLVAKHLARMKRRIQDVKRKVVDELKNRVLEASS